MKTQGNWPRLVVFRSNKYIYGQIIDCDGRVLGAASDVALKGKEASGDGEGRAKKVGEMLAKKALDQKVKRVTFDRGSYRYHGRIKALAEAARAAGLKF